MQTSRIGASSAVPNAKHISDQAMLPLESGCAGVGCKDIVAAHTVGIPVHAVAARPGKAAVAVLEALLSAPRRPVLVTFANPSTALLAQHAPRFARDLLAFDLVLPDGIGMCMAVRFLHGLPAGRVSFDMTSLAPHVFGHAQAGDLSIVLVGGAPGIAERAGGRLAATYPGLRISGALSGYGDVQDTMRQAAALEPDILVCGMGSIRQEAFLLGMRTRGWSGWGFTCGGFLDQLQGGLHYYPAWVNRAQLRWAYRLLREPGRLWRRYLIRYSQFAWRVCAARVRR
ncbi:MAG TPA: WecB/TagA/CpsF family glycosyltransferase [Acetobacteraceae bacterium]